MGHADGARVGAGDRAAGERDAEGVAGDAHGAARGGYRPQRARARLCTLSDLQRALHQAPNAATYMRGGSTEERVGFAEDNDSVVQPAAASQRVRMWMHASKQHDRLRSFGVVTAG